MNAVRLGISRLEVAPIAFGTWQLGGDWGGFDEQEAIEAIQYAREQGVNFFDTAQAYGWGVSEEILGRALRNDLDRNREEIVIATKGGLRMTGGRLQRDSSPAWLRQGVEQSLRGLGVEYIDLYQVHWPDSRTPYAETAGALQELVQEGKLRHIGVSNYSAGQMEEFSRTRPVETVQPPYSMFRREVEQDVLPYAQEHDIGVLVYGPLAHGLLTGTMDTDTSFGEDDWRSDSRAFRGEQFARNVETVRLLEDFARNRGYSVSQLAIAWTLAHPAVHVAIVGSRSRRHIEESIGAASIAFSAEELEEVEQILAGAVPLTGPTPEST